MELISSWLILLLICSMDCLGSEIEHSLQTELFATGYNKHVRPVKVPNETLILQFGLSITQLLDVHEKNQIVTTSCWAEQIWTDYRLQWNPANYSGMDYIVIPTEWVWKPDIVLENSANGKYDIPPTQYVTVESDGFVYLTPPVIFEVPCTMDIKYFPFDIQHCQMKFGPWEYTDDQIMLEKLYDMIVKEKYTENTEWDLLNSTVIIVRDFSECCPEEAYSVLEYTLVLKRRPLYYVVNIVIPCLMMALLTLLVFCLHPDSGEKMTLGISILIAMSVFSLLVADIMPPTSDSVPLIAQYVLFNMYLVTGSIIVSVVVLSIHHRPPNARIMSPWIRKIFMESLPLLLCMKSCKLHDRVDGHGFPSSSWTVPVGDVKANGKRVYVITNSKSEEGDGTQTCIRNNLSSTNENKPADERSNDPIPRDRYNDGVLQKLLEEVILIRMRAERHERDKLVLEDWKYVAKVVDRLFLWVSVIAYVIGTIVMFTQPGMSSYN
ncbi:neuronal acetylcholine receptor subunit beta-3-like [Glandiceps talaboti]